MLNAQPATVYLASPDDPSRTNLKFGFWSEHHCIYFLTIVLLTIVAIGMKFDPTCRQRNLSSTTALLITADHFLWLTERVLFPTTLKTVQLIEMDTGDYKDPLVLVLFLGVTC